MVSFDELKKNDRAYNPCELINNLIDSEMNKRKILESIYANTRGNKQHTHCKVCGEKLWTNDFILAGVCRLCAEILGADTNKLK